MTTAKQPPEESPPTSDIADRIKEAAPIFDIEAGAAYIRKTKTGPDGMLVICFEKLHI